MPNEGIAPPDFTSAVGLVRSLLGDTDAINISAGSGEYVWFSDDEITAILGLYADNPKLAAARMLVTIAGSQALLLKKWSADDLSVDGPAIAEALRRQAKDLRDEVAAGDLAVDIFVISTPGENVEYVPELTPIPYGRIGREAIWPDVDGAWYVDGDGYIVD